MKKLALLLMGMIALPTHAFIAKQTLEQVVDQIADYEELLPLEKADLCNALLELDSSKIRALGKDTGFDVREESLRVIKPFIKKPNNPLFGKWLLKAVFYEQDKEVRFLVDELGADVNALDNCGDCALQNALIKTQECGLPGKQGFALARFLLERGANTELLGSQEFANGCTPLGYIATQVGNSPYDWRWPIQFILSHGASFDLVNARGDSFTQALEAGLEMRRKQLSVRNNITGDKIQKYLSDGRGAIDCVLALSVVAERIAERQERLEVMPFLQYQEGLVNHVFEYMYNHVAQKYNERKEKVNARQDGDIAQHLPQVLEAVGAWLPAWQLAESDPGYGLERLDPIQLVRDYLVEQNAEHEQENKEDES